MERSVRFRRSGQFDVTVAVFPLKPVEGKSHQKKILTLTLSSVYNHMRTKGNEHGRPQAWARGALAPPLEML